MSDNEQDCMEDIFECTLPVPKSKQRGTLITTLDGGKSMWGDKTLKFTSPMMSIENQVEMFQKQVAEAMSVNIRPSIVIPKRTYLENCSVSEKDLITAGYTTNVSIGHTGLTDNALLNDDTQYTIMPSNIAASSFVIETDGGKLQINFDGSIEIEGDVHFDTVAGKFWEAVSENAHGNNSIINRLKKENAELKDRISALETCEHEKPEEPSVSEIMSLIQQRKRFDHYEEGMQIQHISNSSLMKKYLNVDINKDLADDGNFEKAMELVK